VKSMFNWRAPIYAWLLGGLPAPIWGQILVSLLAVCALLLAYTLLLQNGDRFRAVVGTFLLLGVFLWCIDGDAFFAQELWAGILVVISVCAFGLARWRLGTTAGLAALFMRELVLPYALLSLVLAWHAGRRREVLVWVLGLLFYGLFMTGHGTEVARHVTATDRAPDSWLQLGGPGFVLATCRMNAYLFPLPMWVSAFYLPLAILGFAGWRGEQRVRLAGTVGCYVAAFCIVGQPFNNYWGLLYAGLLPFGFVRAPAALRDLTRAACRPWLTPDPVLAHSQS
jgi:hypothetical protein